MNELNAQGNPVDIREEVEAVGRIPVVSKLLEVICRSTGMGFSAIARVTDDRWIACAVRDEISFGLKPGGELKVETTLCHEVHLQNKTIVIDNASTDPVYSSHHTPAMYGLQSYISVPIILKNGQFFGTLCAIDPRPANLNTPETLGMFQLFAELIAFHLSAVDKITENDRLLEEERETAELREQFIAILGHDLRNPVGASLNSAQLLLRMPLDETGVKLARIIRDSSYRIKGLVDNVLDFASGRLGGGMAICRTEDEQVEAILDQVIAEQNIIWPHRIIERKMSLSHSVNCDGKRVAQLFSNLLSNALAYSKPGTPIKVEASTRENKFILSIANASDKIQDETLQRLFLPYSRGKKSGSHEGLGLGLYIASEIARAHGGAIQVQSSDEEIEFTVSMPLSA
ncbi:MAG TPA: GAF domain-containing sensor histidine kinase [Chitinophagaceae bacterium]|nr:GAF domain-containing sensor histidine kinase [Chitinophagaceae bacterium]